MLVLVCGTNSQPEENRMVQQFGESYLAAFSVDSVARRGINSTAHSSSPFQWTKTQIFSVFSPLGEDLICSVTHGFESLAVEWGCARCEEKKVRTKLISFPAAKTAFLSEKHRTILHNLISND